MSGKSFWMMLTVGLFLAAGHFTGSPVSAGSRVHFSAGPTVSVVSGKVQVMGYGNGGWFDAQPGLVLKPGDMIRTGRGARVEIRHYSGTTRLYENTILAIPSIFSRGGVKDLKKVDLEKGAGIFHLDHDLLKGGFEVRTRQVIAGVKGTTFVVQAAGQESSVAVVDGRVSVSFRDVQGGIGQNVMVGPGKKVEAVNGKGIGRVQRYREKDSWKGWKTGLSSDQKKAGKGMSGIHKRSGAVDKKGDMGSFDNGASHGGGEGQGETGRSHGLGKGLANSIGSGGGL